MKLSITTCASLPELEYAEYLSVSNRPVTAIQLAAEEEFEHPYATTGKFVGQKGTWKVTYGTRADGSLDVAICQDDIFRQSYDQITENRYQKKSDVITRATRINSPLDIVTSEGPSHGEAGDWLLVGANGDLHFCDHETFTVRYKPIQA